MSVTGRCEMHAAPPANNPYKASGFSAYRLKSDGKSMLSANAVKGSTAAESVTGSVKASICLVFSPDTLPHKNLAPICGITQKSPFIPTVSRRFLQKIINVKSSISTERVTARHKNVAAFATFPFKTAQNKRPSAIFAICPVISDAAVGNMSWPGPCPA